MKSIIPLCLLALSVAQDTQDEHLPYTCYVYELNATIDYHRDADLKNSTSHHFIFSEKGTIYEADGYIINEDSDAEYLKVFGLGSIWTTIKISSLFEDYYRQYIKDQKGYTPNLERECSTN
ncbi:uncharacterized protein LOC135073674 [Ostrinia nubilalis]|uniref:uncharacterized protein LOC135073674 n=1 Tax=Ostrinia nubilalis TaxID=29057 RepID=UPI0030822384